MKTQNRFVTVATLLLFAGPIWVKIMARGITHAHDFLAGDVYYYLVIARNVNSLGFFTYDQEHLSNSFHPLWQLFCIVLIRICMWFSVTLQWVPVLLVASSTFFIALAILLLAKSFALAHQRIPVPFILLPFGVYGLTKAPIHPNYGTLWSYADGMESCLVVLAYALLLYLMVRPDFLKSTRSAALLALAMSFLFLARLDHAFFAVALFPLLGLQSIVLRDKQRFIHMVLAGAICTGVMLLYMAVNHYYFGIFMPLSGAIKSNFPHFIYRPIAQALEELRPPYNSHLLWRLAQVLIPMCFALATLIIMAFKALLKKRQRPMDFAMLVSAVFVLLLGFYNFFYVGYFGPGHWYFPASVLFVSCVSIHMLAWLPPVFPIRRHEGICFGAKVIVAVLLVLAGFHISYNNEEAMRLHRTGTYELLANEAEPLRAFYAEHPPKIIEYADGELAWATGFPAFPAYLLTADKEAVDLICHQQSHLLDVALARGFDRVILWWMGMPLPMHAEMGSDEARAALNKTGLFFVHAHLNNYPEPWPFTIAVEYVSRGQTLAVIRLEPLDNDDSVSKSQEEEMARS